mgnify:CR=1 FL=1
MVKKPIRIWIGMRCFSYLPFCKTWFDNLGSYNIDNSKPLSMV